MLSGSALWALLPVLVRGLGRGPTVYGAFLSALGAGAVAGATLLPFFKHRATLDQLIGCGTLIFGSVTLASALAQNVPLISVIMLAGGLSWILVISSLNVAARMVVPAWVQARSLSVYLLVAQGGMAVGSLGWGVIAETWGYRWALAGAGAGLVSSMALAFKYSLIEGLAHNLTPAGKWPTPEISSASPAESTPVLVTVQYEISKERTAEFISEIRGMELIRRRDGALQWGLFSDPAVPGRYVEEFLVESWLEHLRQHARFTVSDQNVQQRTLAMHTGATAPRVTHYFAVEE